MDLLEGSSSLTSTVDFKEGEKQFRATMPSHQMWVTVKDILVYEEYEFFKEFRLSNLPLEATVLDAGAFVGLYSLKASPYASHVVAIEPNRASYRYLEENIRMNGARNVESLNVGLSDKAGPRAFVESGTVSQLAETGESRVQTLTLDEVCDRHDRIDLMKMDIEGSEYPVILSSMTALKRISKIVAEIHITNASQRMKFPSLLDRLESNHFEVKLIRAPFQPAYFGLSKPWHCPLSKYNHRSVALYRLFLSALYGARPITARVRRFMETGSTVLLFASKT